jgi:hypothetical protein
MLDLVAVEIVRGDKYGFVFADYFISSYGKGNETFITECICLTLGNNISSKRVKFVSDRMLCVTIYAMM